MIVPKKTTFAGEQKMDKIGFIGLGAMGGPGVTRALEIIQKELDLTMAFCGQTDLRAIDRRILFSATERYEPAPAARAAA